MPNRQGAGVKEVAGGLETAEGTVIRSNEKRPYETPQLRHLGSVRELTLSAASGPRPELVGPLRRQ
jgi:hypothetical protein